MEENKKTIEDLAWDAYQNGSLIKWETCGTLREDFHKHNSYEMYMKHVKDLLSKGIIPEPRISKPPKKEYPIIKVPSNGQPDWMEGARTWLFVYSKKDGNFILEGYLGEVEEYLKKHYTHYFYYRSLWNGGKSRGSWKFWKKSIGIFSPDKHYREWKFVVRPYTSYRGVRVSEEDVSKKTFKFKRMPHKWIPEFNKL